MATSTESPPTDLTAKYVVFICADDYTESIDIATALHPQTILATKYAGDIIADPFGYPLRLRTSTKLGYKNAKWIKAIEVTTRTQVIPAIEEARKHSGSVLIDFKVEQEDSVYPMVAAGAALHDMIRRPSPLVETAEDA